MSRELRATARFDKDFKALPAAVVKLVGEKLRLYQSDERHPSLRVRKMQGHPDIWELSLTKNYRDTFELTDDVMLLRRIGTHDVLRSP